MVMSLPGRFAQAMLDSGRTPRLPTAVAAAAHGVLTRADLERHGFGPHAVAHAVDSGDLIRVGRGLFVVAGSPDTEARRAVLATTALRGALSFDSSAAWWGIPGFKLEPFHVTRFRPGSTAPPGSAILHRPVRLLPHQLTEWRGVQVTRPDRTLFDLAAVAHPGRVERAYDTMWSRGLVTNDSMARTLEELRGRGRSGVVLMRRLIEARRDLPQPTGSRLERRFEVLNERAGIPRLRRQVDVGDDTGWIGRMDFAGDERRLIAEIDSAIHHAALLDARQDRERTERLRRAGWAVCRWTEDDLWYEAGRVVRELREAWFNAPLRS